MTDEQISKLAFGCFWQSEVKNGVSTNFPRIVTPIIIEDAIRKALSAPPEAEPFAWAVFASDTHELIDVTLIKHEEPGEYAEPLYRTPQSPLVPRECCGKFTINGICVNDCPHKRQLPQPSEGER